MKGSSLCASLTLVSRGILVGIMISLQPATAGTDWLQPAKPVLVKTMSRLAANNKACLT